MKRVPLLLAIVLQLLPMAALAMSALPASTTTATVFIANYSDEGRFLGWGSGFFVDEAIIVTNKHVIEGGDWYRIYATGDDENLKMNCFRDITKNDVKVNLDDDVAYMRAYLPCTHGTMLFGADPQVGDALWVIGYPYRDSVAQSLNLSVTAGVMLEESWEGWLATDAYMDIGSSGGPVVSGTEVVGVAVAKGVDGNGAFLEGYFIPSSVILNGLLYANDSRFGYTPQALPVARSSRSRSSSSSSESRRSSAGGDGSVSSVPPALRLSNGSVSSSRSSSRSSAPRSLASSARVSPLQRRTCERVDRLFRGNAKMLQRVNERLMKRFGFVCR